MSRLARLTSLLHRRPPNAPPSLVFDRVHYSWRFALTVPPQDPFKYMSNPDDERVRNYVANERAHTDLYWKRRLGVLQSPLLHDMMALIPPEQHGAVTAERIGAYEYFREKDGEYWSECRRPVAGGSSQVIVSLRALLHRFDYANVRSMVISPDERLAALSIDTTSDERYQLHVVDIESGETIEENLVGNIVSVLWGKDSETLFYTSVGSDGGLLRPGRVLQRRVASSPLQDVLVHDERNEQFFIDIQKTRDDQFLVINANSKLSSEVHLYDFQLATKRILVPRKTGREAYVDCIRNTFFMITNQSQGVIRPDGYVIAASPQAPLLSDPELIFNQEQPPIVSPTDSKHIIEDLHLFREFMVVSGRRAGLPELRVVEFPKGNDNITACTVSTHTIHLPEPVCEITPGINRDVNATAFRFSTSSPLSPEQTFSYRIPQRSLSTLRASIHEYSKEGANMLRKLQASCVVERVHAKTSQRPEIPITLVKATQGDGPKATLVVAYGAYGTPLSLRFREEWVPLLLRTGWTIALVHVRGGGEFGHAWHNAGRGLLKPESIGDLHAAVEWLVDNYISKPGEIVGNGVSAGGLLFGAVANQNPSLFRALVLNAPFLDIVSEMTNPDLPLTQHEYDEWGYPDQAGVKASWANYSPYDNLDPRSGFPDLFLSTSLNDPLVPFWHSLKYLAKVRRANSPVAAMLNIEDIGGHYGDGSPAARFQQRSLEYAFCLSSMGK